jgi:zinc-binding in reverse transcriptase
MAVQRRLQDQAKSNLSLAGRVVILNSILNALPLYYMQVFCLLQGVIDRLIMLIRWFLWRCSQSFSGGHCLITWGALTLPKKGGWGILDLRAQNDSLLLRWLWMIRTEPTSIWSSALHQQFGIQSVQDLLMVPPEFASYFVRDLQSLVPLFSSCTSIPQTNQSSLWMLTQDGCFSAKSAYEFITRPGIAQQLPRIPWKVRIPSKVKIFLWLLQRNWLLTNANLRKRNWPSGETCVLCNRQLQEDTEHLFLRCPYARRIWNDILPTSEAAPTDVQQLPQLLHIMSRRSPDHSRLIAAACWNIWKERNRRIFQTSQRPSERLLMHVYADNLLWDNWQELALQPFRSRLVHVLSFRSRLAHVIEQA